MILKVIFKFVAFGFDWERLDFIEKIRDLDLNCSTELDLKDTQRERMSRETQTENRDELEYSTSSRSSRSIDEEDVAETSFDIPLPLENPLEMIGPTENYQVTVHAEDTSDPDPLHTDNVELRGNSIK